MNRVKHAYVVLWVNYALGKVSAFLKSHMGKTRKPGEQRHSKSGEFWRRSQGNWRPRFSSSSPLGQSNKATHRQHLHLANSLFQYLTTLIVTQNKKNNRLPPPPLLDLSTASLSTSVV